MHIAGAVSKFSDCVIIADCRIRRDTRLGYCPASGPVLASLLLQLLGFRYSCLF